MKHLLNICNINGAEVEPLPIAGPKWRNQMYKHNELSGRRFGKLTVIERSGTTADRHIIWGCVCDCGALAYVSEKDLVSGHTQSCGCLQRERTSTARHKHGGRKTHTNAERLYSVWGEMRGRCHNPENKDYRHYGGRGIKVCNEWSDYSKFREWAVGAGYNPLAPYGKCTIDRINNDGNYEPSNCRWVDMATQNKNRRNVRKEATE